MMAAAFFQNRAAGKFLQRAEGQRRAEGAEEFARGGSTHEV